METNNNLKRTRTELKQRLLLFARNSNVNGLKHVVKSRSTPVKVIHDNVKKTRCAWVAVLAASAGCMAVLLAPTARDGAALSYTPDTRYLLWTTTFPAVTVCETFYPAQAQRKLMKSDQFGYLMKNLSYNYQRYLTNLLYARGSCTKELCVPCGSTVPCDLPWRQIIELIFLSCSELLTDCLFNGVAFPCCARFRAVDAEHGLCYSFNTLQHKNSTQDSLMTVNRTTGPGLLTFRVNFDAHISVHSPEELSTSHLDTSSKLQFYVVTREWNWVELLFSLVEMANDPPLKSEGKLVRSCQYLEDVPVSSLFIYPVYSYGACMLAKSTKYAFEECGCVHPARDVAFKEKYCNYTGLNCLVPFVEANKIKLGTEHENNQAPCLPSCSESDLTEIHTTRKWVSGDGENGTRVNIRMSSLPHLRYARSLVRSNLDKVASVGGVIGLLFGASILSVVEIFYLILRNP